MTGLLLLASVLGVAWLSKRGNAISGVYDNWYKRKFHKYSYEKTIECIKYYLQRQEQFGENAVRVEIRIFDAKNGSKQQSTVFISDHGNEEYLIVSYNNAKRISFLYELPIIFL